MYILQKDSFTFYGPNQWNPKLIESYIEDDFEIEMVISQTEPVSGTSIGNGIMAYKVIRTDYPEYNTKTQKLDGPFYTIEGDFAVQSFTAINKDIEHVKSELKSIVADSRWKKEVSGVEATIQGNVLNLTTQRGDRDIYLQALLGGIDGSKWKLVLATGETVWLNLSLAELKTIVDAIIGHIQTAFSWEDTTVNQINSSTTLAELDAIDLGIVVPANPVI
jgi:hypothetical protein